MATTLQIVAADLTTVLFDFNDETGANPGGVKAAFALGGSLTLGPGEPELVTISPPSAAGGTVVYRRDTLGQMSWRQRFYGADYGDLSEGIGELARLLATGGVCKFVPHGTTDVRYIDFEPSVAPVLHDGQALGLWQALQRFDVGVDLSLLIQPYLRGAELLGSVNLLKNSTLLLDNDATANRPDNWTWDNTTGITAETMSTDAVNWGYQFTIADSGVHNLQQTTAVASVASGDVAPMQFEARVTAVAGTPQARCMVEYMQSDGTTQVGADQTTTITTLTTSWQRITLTPSAAGALTSRVRASIQIDNTDATSVVVQLRKAQVEKAAAPSLFRAGAETVAYDPAATANANRRMPVYCQGNAASLARLKVTADAATLGRVTAYRTTELPVNVLKATLHKQLESGTLGGGTASAADANASGGNTAEVTYSASNPSMRADASVGGTGNTITLTKPAGLVAGDVMVSIIWRADETSAIAAPSGWKLLGTKQQTANTFTLKSILYVFWKVADADDVAGADFTFNVVFDGAGTRSYRAWVGAFIDVDNLTPIDTFTFSTEDNNATPTATGIVTSKNNNMVITAYAGNGASGSLTFSTPTGTTPTYTEQDDGTADVSYRGMSVNTGVLATAAFTGNKNSTAAFAVDAVMIFMALNIAPAALAARSTVPFSSLPVGDYDVWLRFYPTAASRQRIRVEWAPMASPAVYTSLGDYIVDTTGASSFAYVSRMMGRIHVPSDYAVPTVTIRVSSGLELTSAALLRLDAVILMPSAGHVAQMTSPSVLATGEFLVGEAGVDRVYHLDTSGQVEEIGTVAGPVPVELQPGLNLLAFEFQQVAAAGFVDRAAVLTAVPTVAVDHAPRYRL